MDHLWKTYIIFLKKGGNITMMKLCCANYFIKEDLFDSVH